MKEKIKEHFKFFKIVYIIWGFNILGIILLTILFKILNSLQM